MSSEFSYAKGRIPATAEFITKEMDDFDKYFAGITWKEYKFLETIKAKALEKTVENILTALIEISGTISVEEGRTVENYYTAINEAASILGFDEETALSLAKLAIQRNRIVHRYLDFKWEAIKSYNESRDLLREFLKRVLEREKNKA